MGKFALLIGACAFVAAVMPQGMYVGMGLGGFSSICGFWAYHNRESRPWSRLAAACGLSLGLCALTIAICRYALTLWAIARLSEMVST